MVRGVWVWAQATGGPAGWIDAAGPIRRAAFNPLHLQKYPEIPKPPPINPPLQKKYSAI